MISFYIFLISLFIQTCFSTHCWQDSMCENGVCVDRECVTPTDSTLETVVIVIMILLLLCGIGLTLWYVTACIVPDKEGDDQLIHIGGAASCTFLVIILQVVLLFIWLFEEPDLSLVNDFKTYLKK